MRKHRKPDAYVGWQEAIRKMGELPVPPMIRPKMLSREELIADNTLLKAEVERLHKALDHMMTHCADAECTTCSEIVCPHGEPFHFHHDGCPACAVANGEVDG